MAARSGFASYIKAAFLWHWNLLALGAGAVFAFLSRQPGMVLPLLTAAELAYLGMLSTHPRFRKAIDARNLPASQEESPDLTLAQIRKVIKPAAWTRFEDLRDRCKRMNALAFQFRGPDTPRDDTISDMQSSALERLLWMFLKLLYSHDAIENFLNATNRGSILRDIASSEKEIEASRERKRSERILRALEDKLAILRQRLENHDRASETRELLSIELDRIEQKVQAISETMLDARNASDIGSQVDGIAAGVAATEEALRGLDIAPTIRQEEAPRFLRVES